MGVDLLRGSVGNSPVVEAVSSETAMAFGEIRWHRRCRANHLIGDALQWSGDSQDEVDCDAGSFEGFAVGDEAGLLVRFAHRDPPSRSDGRRPANPRSAGVRVSPRSQGEIGTDR